MPRGGPLCRKVLCAERIGGGPCVRGRPLCREEVLYAGRFYVLRELEEASVLGGGSSDSAE